MLASHIRGFCREQNDGFYKVYENYSGRMMFGRGTIGIVVKRGRSHLEMLLRLARYLESKGYEDPFSELEGVAVDELGLDIIVYFPSIRRYL